MRTTQQAARVSPLSHKELDRERWLPVPEWEGLYSVSDMGRVRSEERYIPCRGALRAVPERILKASPQGRMGYPRVRLCAQARRETQSVHRLVLLAFTGPCPDGHETYHRDGCAGNARLENLKWAPLPVKHAARVRRGRSGKGTKNPLNKLSESDVRQIRRMVKAGRSRIEIATKFDVSIATIRDLKAGVTWAWLDKATQ